MKYTICSILFLILLIGCRSTSRKELSSVAELASEKTVKKVSSFFDDNYELEGTVIKVENHPVSVVASSTIHAITYHIKYKLDGPLSPRFAKYNNNKKVKSKVYIIPITDYGYKPTYKVGDRVKIKGWILKCAQ